MSNEELHELKTVCEASVCDTCGSVEMLDRAFILKNRLLEKTLYEFAKPTNKKGDIDE